MVTGMLTIVSPAVQAQDFTALEILIYVLCTILLGFVFSFGLGFRSPAVKTILKEDDEAKRLDRIHQKVDAHPKIWDKLNDKELFMLAKNLLAENSFFPTLKVVRHQKLIRLVNARKVSKQTLNWIYTNAVDAEVASAVLASPKLTTDEKVFLSLQPGRK